MQWGEGQKDFRRNRRDQKQFCPLVSIANVGLMNIPTFRCARVRANAHHAGGLLHCAAARRPQPATSQNYAASSLARCFFTFCSSAWAGQICTGCVFMVSGHGLVLINRLRHLSRLLSVERPQAVLHKVLQANLHSGSTSCMSSASKSRV